MGRLVQPPPATRTDRQYAACRGRAALRCPTEGDCAGGVTQTNQPPANQERFKIDTWLLLVLRHISSRPPPLVRSILMDAVELLLSRDSALKLTEPAPSEAEL